MQNSLRSPPFPRRLLFGGYKRSERSRRLQTGGFKARADGAPDAHASAYRESGSRTASEVSPQGSGLPWVCKHRKSSFARIRAQAEHFCGGHGIPLGRLSAMLAGSLNTRFSMSAFAYRQRMIVCLDNAGKSPSLSNRRSYSNVETIAANERDHACAPVNAFTPQPSPTLKKVMLPLDDLAELLFSAAVDPASADMDQIRSQMGIRFRRTPLETFISDLHQKLAMLTLPLRTSKPLLKKRSFLFSSPEHFQAIIKVLQDYFNSSEKACRFVVRNSSIIEKPVEHLKKMLIVILEFQIQKQTVERSCDIFKYDIDRTRDVLLFLKSWGVRAAGRNKMLRRNSDFVRFPVEVYTQPVLGFLESIGMSKPEILALLQDHPDILCRSVANNLMPKHGLCQKLGWNFSLVIPFIKYHAYDRILSQIAFLKEQGLSEEIIVKLVEKEPRVLGKSKQDLKLKLDFLLHTHNRAISELISFPACLCYSFKCRILPRFRFLENKALLDSLSLPYILSLKSSTFRSVFNVPESVNPI